MTIAYYVQNEKDITELINTISFEEEDNKNQLLAKVDLVKRLKSGESLDEIKALEESY